MTTLDDYRALCAGKRPKRYSIMVRERSGIAEFELLGVETNPEQMAEAVRGQKRKSRVPKYEHVYVIDHQAKARA
jgi:hypothetical protein